MLLVVSSVKLVAEIALMALAGQWLLGLLAGSKRDSNLFYQLLQIVTRPFVKAVRFITPRVVLDRHIPLAAFVALGMLWIIATLAKIQLCLQVGVRFSAAANPCTCWSYHLFIEVTRSNNSPQAACRRFVSSNLLVRIVLSEERWDRWSRMSSRDSFSVAMNSSNSWA